MFHNYRVSYKMPASYIIMTPLVFDAFSQSPKGIPMARKTINRSPSGFFQNVFTLPPYPDFGIWTARSFYRGQVWI